MFHKFTIKQNKTMKNLIKAVEKDNRAKKNECIKFAKSLLPEQRYNRFSYVLPYGKKTFDLEYLIKRINRYYDKQLNSSLELFKMSFEPINELTITIEWKRSQIWGANPNASTYLNGWIESGSIGGCGYDKESTAVARVLNQIHYFKHLMYTIKNKPKNLKLSNRDLFGYGSGYGLLPYFEGGVGCSCYPRIFEKLGYSFKNISSGKSFDVYRIEKL